MIFPLIETKEGLENVEDIVALEGIDGLWLGHFDLSCSMGIPGQFEHPDFIAALERVANAGKASGKPLARVVGTAEEGAEEFKRGFEIIAVSGDCWLLQQAMKESADALRSACTA